MQTLLSSAPLPLEQEWNKASMQQSNKKPERKNYI